MKDEVTAESIAEFFSYLRRAVILKPAATPVVDGSSEIEDLGPAESLSEYPCDEE